MPVNITARFECVQKNIEKSKNIGMLDFPHMLINQETFRVISNKMTSRLITFHSKKRPTFGERIVSKFSFNQNNQLSSFLFSMQFEKQKKHFIVKVLF